MELLILIFAIFGLAFLIKESDGPWGCMAWVRSWLMKNKYVGVFFYKLLDCYFCVGFHCGWMVYLLHAEHYSIQFFILWGLAGAAISLILDAALSKLQQSRD
ncbi:MAG: hypothetical protein AB7I18_14590 [Candidatus Berkiella sp.]|jgi:hypothetical protein